MRLKGTRSKQSQRHIAVGMSIGIAAGAGFSLVTGKPALLGVGIALGALLGLTLNRAKQ